MYSIIASMALLATVISATASNFLDVSPEERPEVAIRQLCAAYPDLQSCQTVEPMEKRKSAYMRFGRSSPMQFDEMPSGDMEKRKSAYMRFGKRADPSIPHGLEMEAAEVAKRKSAYMRFGKRALEMDNDVAEPMEKRKSAYMRFGKRSSPFDGESEVNGQEVAKRKSAYMRFGR